MSIETSNLGGLFKLSTFAASNDVSSQLLSPLSPSGLFVPKGRSSPVHHGQKLSFALVSLVLSPRLDNLQAALRGQGAAQQAAGVAQIP